MFVRLLHCGENKLHDCECSSVSEIYRSCLHRQEDLEVLETFHFDAFAASDWSLASWETPVRHYGT
ncbi:hypothetical protein EYZ11_003248 [Aspergillus tanneri]|uniref:Uncharacterized protein n=1 Tax=Aspergillus tanneri TaxID=1220188 RepID=A0A4S3JPG4_9EURO|nr:hypothetical protein EYZ11_003248 [Aspergillus tanneri]